MMECVVRPVVGENDGLLGHKGWMLAVRGEPEIEARPHWGQNSLLPGGESLTA